MGTRLLSFAAVAGLALAPVASPGSAWADNGAYSPFPSPAPLSHATGFYADLGVDLSAAAVRRGVRLDGLPAAVRPSGPAVRAGVGDGTGGVAALVGVLLLASVGAGVIAMRRHLTADTIGDGRTRTRDHA